MKFDYTWNEGIKSMIQGHTVFPVDNCKVVIQLHYYMLGNITEVDKVDANMEYIRVNIGLRGIMDMIRVVKIHFANCIYTWDDVSYEIIKSKSGISLACDYAKADARTARVAMTHDMLKDYIYLPLITVLNCYEIGCCDWEDILESDLSPEVKIAMMYTKHIVPEGAAVCNADIILEMTQRVINAERLKSMLETETDSHFTEVCTRVLMFLAGVYYEMTHEGLFVKYIRQPDITAATKNVVSKLYPDHPDWVDWCDDDSDKSKFIFRWSCSVGDYGWNGMYRFSDDTTVSVPQLFIDALTTGHLIITIKSSTPIYAVAKEFKDGEPQMTRYDELRASFTGDPDYAGIYHVNLCKELVLGVLVDKSTLTFKFIPVGDTNAVFSESEVIGVTLSYNTELIGISKVERESEKSIILTDGTVWCEDEGNQFKFKWICGDPSFGWYTKYKFSGSTIPVPQQFISALTTGCLEIFINAPIYTVSKDSTGANWVLRNNIQQVLITDEPDSDGIYHVELCEKFDLDISVNGNVLTFNLIPTNNTVSIFFTTKVIDVTLSYDDKSAKPADVPKVECELSKPNIFHSCNVKIINESDDCLTFSWVRDGCEGYNGMNIYRAAVIEIPERFTCTLREGHIKVYIFDSSMKNTAKMYMIIPEDGTDILSGSLESGAFAQRVFGSDGIMYYVDICENFGLGITRIGNILTFSGITGTFRNLPLLCTEGVITVSLAIRDDECPVTVVYEPTDKCRKII